MIEYKNYLKLLEKLRPTLVPYDHIVVATITTLIFANRRICITLWLIGPSSSGKGEILKLST